MISKRHLSLSSWLVLLVIGVATPLLIFAGAMLWWVQRTRAAEQDRGLQDRARALATTIDSEMRSWQFALQGLAASNEVYREQWAAFDVEARRVAALFDAWIVLSDAATQQRINTLRPYGEPLPKGNPATLAVFEAKQPVILDPFIGAVVQRRIMSVAVPVFRDGRVIYCLNMNFFPDRLTQLLQGQRLPETSVASITDRRGAIVARSVEAERRVGQQAVGWKPEQALAEHGVFTSKLYDGREARVAFQRLAEVPWLLYVATPTAELAGNRPLSIFVLIGAGLGLVAVGIAVAIGRRIAAPVIAIAEESDAVVQGRPPDLSVPPTSREIAQLQQALTRAAAKVQAYTTERERSVRAEEAARVAAESADALRQSERRVRTFFESPMMGTLFWTLDGRIIDANEKFLQMVGYSQDDLRAGRISWAAMTPAEYHELDAKALAELQATGVDTPYEKEFIRKDGSRVPIFIGGAMLEERTQEGVAFVLDITERKRAEASLRTAMAEKDAALATNQTLLREVHHRVKNNLQMLCDMLYLQAEAGASAEAKAALQDAYGRVYAIARLHEQLYQSLHGEAVPMTAYLQRLVGGFESVYPAVTLRLEAPDAAITLDVDRAIHTGLIVNELVTNALKHAFPKSRPGVVTVRLLRSDDRVELQVRDTGPGLPPDLNLDQAKSLGLRIVHILAKRLNATVQIENHQGAAFTITFPLHADASLDPAPA